MDQDKIDFDDLPDDLFDDPPPMELSPPREQNPVPPAAAPMDEDETKVADIFGDFDSDMEDGGASMMDSLRVCGVTSKRARKKIKGMIQPTFIEAYGRTITDYTNASRRNLNVKGLSSLDFRTPKANGAPWDFRRRSDRQAAIKLVDDLNPDWILGAPPCTASPSIFL